MVGFTPTWDPSSHILSDVSPAWDPSSQTPLPQARPSRPVHWLDDPALEKLRFKLETTDPRVENPFVEFLGMENDQVLVRDKVDNKLVSFESVSAMLPKEVGDMVTLREGELRGVKFKIVEMTKDRCVLRKPGVRPTKKKPDHNCLISDVIQVYPGSR